MTHKWVKAALVVAVGVTLGLSVAKPATGTNEHERGGRKRVSASPSVSRSLGSRASVKPTPGQGVTGAEDANQAAGWAIIREGSPAAVYWAQHGVGTADDDTSGVSACEAALRVQFVRGYLGTTTDGRKALWQVECGGVPGDVRDDMLSAAVEWSATHGNG